MRWRGALPEHFFIVFKQLSKNPGQKTTQHHRPRQKNIKLNAADAAGVVAVLVAVPAVAAASGAAAARAFSSPCASKREAVAALTPAKLADHASRDERVSAVVADVRVVLGLAQEVRVGSPAVRAPNGSVGPVSRGSGDMMSPAASLPPSSSASVSLGDLLLLRAPDHDGLARRGHPATPNDDRRRNHAHRLLGVLWGLDVG